MKRQKNMKSRFLKLCAAGVLSLGVMYAASFNYVATGGFVEGTETGTGTFSHGFEVGPVELNGSQVYKEIHWGPNYSPGSIPQSHLEVVPAAGTINSDSVFNNFGTLIHYNQPISGGSLEFVQIKWHLNLQGQGPANDFNRTWVFDLWNWETTNNPGSDSLCPRNASGAIVNPSDGHQYLGEGSGSDTQPCADAHDFGSVADNNYTWVDGGTVYNIEISGFYDALGVLRQTFWADENQDTNGSVKFAITEIGPATASVGNLVWLDSNNNGIQDETVVQGVNNVKVELFRDDDTLYATTWTDPNGLYSFVDVNTTIASGNQYYLKFTCPVASELKEFSPKNIFGAVTPIEDSNDSDVNNTGYTDLFDLNANTTDIDVGIKCGSIGDFVWNDKNQNGIQETGEAGVEGVTINLYKTSDLVTPFETTVTGITGEYIFIPLGSDDYVVEFVLPTGYYFSPQSAGSDDSVDSDADVTDGRTRVLTVDLNTSQSCHFDLLDAGIYPEYNITKDVNVTMALNGQRIMYTITVTNGTERNATDVNVSDQNFPNSEMNWVSDNATHGSFNEATGVWVIGLLEPGVTAELNVTVDLDTEEVSLDNNACVVSEQNTIPVCDQAVLRVITPAIDIEKTTNGQNADAGTGPIVLAGSTVAWKYTVTNTGDVNLTNIMVVDDMEGTITCPLATLAVGESMTCERNGTAITGQYDNNATVTADTPTGPQVQDSDPSHYFGAAPGIDIEKATNGQDSDVAPGEYIDVGDTVTWTYVVTNTGNIDLNVTSVTDSVEGTITCPSTTLAVSESMTCERNGTAVAGQYENNATVTAASEHLQEPVSDSDLSHYFGVNAGIDIEKATNGQDADIGTGPLVVTGSTVTWTYVVTNTGNVVLDPVQVTDSVEGTISCPKTTLAVSESMTCTKTGTAVAGQYTNTGTATGTAPTGSQVSDEDISHYVAEAPSIDIEKATNGQDADTGTGPLVVTGSTVTWTYVVTNTGDVTLINIVVNDNVEGTITCPQSTLAAGGSMQCTHTGTATTGQYTNTGAVTGSTSIGTQVGDSDQSHYFAEAPAIDIQKHTNGVDADIGPGPIILPGSTVTWTYIVTNTGDVALTNIVVNDNVEGTITCPQSTLAAGGSMQCTHIGTATTGQYTNTGTVTGSTLTGAQVGDSDQSHYLAEAPSIDVEKRTNGEDADNVGEGPTLIVGDTVTWQYTVTNTGDVTLVNIVLNDDQIGVISCPLNTLTAGASMICTATGTVTEGPYENNATASGMSSYTEKTVNDSDLSHYTGIAGVNLGDYVWYDDDNNGIQDEGEDPVEGMTVTLLDENGTEITDINGIGSVETDENGTYNFFVRPGIYIIRFSPEDLPENNVFTQKNAGGDESADSDADATTGESDPITVTREANYDVDAGIYCTCYDVKESDSGSAMGVLSGILMMLTTLIFGLYFVRREEQFNQSRR